MIYTTAPQEYEISVNYPNEKNYTPSDVMKRWAKENNKVFARGMYGTPYINLFGKRYGYGSWKIIQNEDSTETVVVVLKRV